MKFIDLDEDNASKGLKIVESVVNMARKLRLLVIAEGAQTKQQVDQLLSVGCRYIQGYYFHEPLPVGRMEAVGRTSRRPAFLGYVKRFHAWQLCARQRPYHA